MNTNHEENRKHINTLLHCTFIHSDNQLTTKLHFAQNLRFKNQIIIVIKQVISSYKQTCSDAILTLPPCPEFDSADTHWNVPLENGGETEH